VTAAMRTTFPVSEPAAFACDGGTRVRRAGAPLVIAIVSAARGVGRTTATTNLAAGLGASGQKVLVLDADHAHPRVAELLGVAHDRDIGHLFAAQCEAAKVIVPGPPGVHIVAGRVRPHDQGGNSSSRYAALMWALDSMPQQVDVLLIDTAADPGPGVALLARAAHQVIVVVDETTDSLSSSAGLIAMLSRESAIDHFMILANQIRTPSAGEALLERLQRVCDERSNIVLEYAGGIPRDGAVQRAAHAGRSVLEAEPTSRASRAFQALATRVGRWSRPSGPRGQFEFFLEQLVSAGTLSSPAAGPQDRPAIDPLQTMEALVRQHAPLVKRIACYLLRRLPREVEVEDLMQVGMISLLQAAKSHKSQNNSSLETYAGIRIRGAMLDYLRKSDWGPRSLRRRQRTIERAKHRLQCTQGATPKSTDVAAAIGMPVAAYHRILRDLSMSRFATLDDLGPALDESMADKILDDWVDPSVEIERQQRDRAIAAAVESLSEPDRTVVLLYYRDELLLREIGDRLGVSESRASQLRRQAVTRLRARIGRDSRNADAVRPVYGSG